MFLDDFGKKCVYLFDSHDKDCARNIFQQGSALLMNFETLADFEDYLKLI